MRAQGSLGSNVPYDDVPYDEYDALGRLTVVSSPEGVAQYEYDAVGNLLRITTRRYTVSHARNGIAYLWVEALGHPGRPLASLLGVRPQAVYQAMARGQAGHAEWDRPLET